MPAKTSFVVHLPKIAGSFFPILFKGSVAFGVSTAIAKSPNSDCSLIA
ncbi:MAG: hypothetical protein V7K40_07310 [Nostoc sp.]